MNKILVIGNYQENSGYSRASREYILALDSVGVDVVCRPIKMTNTLAKLPNRIKELEKKDTKGVDTLFQYNLPNNFIRKNGLLNIGGFAYETEGTPLNHWWQHLELMDTIVVPATYQVENLRKTLPGKISTRVFCAINQDGYKPKESLFDFGLPKGCFKFYSISDFNKRKNVISLITSYFTAFCSDENVALVLKCSIPGRSEKESKEFILNTIKEIKAGCRKFGDNDRYPPIILISSYMSDDDINKLHQSCDVCVIASKGEAFSYTTVDAMAFGNPIIAPNYGVFRDYTEITPNPGYLVGGSISPCFSTDGVDNVYSSYERWFNVSIDELAVAMTNAYNNQDLMRSPKERLERSESTIANLNRKKIGQNLKTTIELSYSCQ